MKPRSYQGRALWAPAARQKRGVRPGWILLLFAITAGALYAARAPIAASVPYRALFTVRQVEVKGAIYLTEAEVRRAAGMTRPQDFLRADLGRAERKLSAHARIEHASVTRELPRRIVLTIVERKPTAIVRAGRLLEVDRGGVILPPVASGVLPDVPVVSGVTVADVNAGRRIEDPDFARALAHLRALAWPSIGLPGPVSQVDVSESERTVITLAPSGVDLILPNLPPSERLLSSIKVVLADLASRGLSASRIDLTGQEVVAVRSAPVPVPVSAEAADSVLSRSQLNSRRG